MTVCQGCGRSCNSDLCCPTCASMNRSSFFCTQECFANNWKDHCKLHSIIKQQIRMADLDDRERQIRGLSAASNAFSAISELFRAPTPEPPKMSPERVSIEKNEAATFKDHRVRPIDKLIGPNGLMGGFRIILLLTAGIFLVFVKINSMISEIPMVVEKRTVVKVSEALGSQGAVANSAALVSPVKEEKPSDGGSLRGEVERLRKQVDQYKGLYEASLKDAAPSLPSVESIAVTVPAAAEKTISDNSGDSSFVNNLSGDSGLANIVSGDSGLANIVSGDSSLENIVSGDSSLLGTGDGVFGVVRQEEAEPIRALRQVGAVGISV